MFYSSMYCGTPMASCQGLWKFAWKTSKKLTLVKTHLIYRGGFLKNVVSLLNLFSQSVDLIVKSQLIRFWYDNLINMCLSKSRLAVFPPSACFRALTKLGVLGTSSVGGTTFHIEWNWNDNVSRLSNSLLRVVLVVWRLSSVGGVGVVLGMVGGHWLRSVVVAFYVAVFRVSGGVPPLDVCAFSFLHLNAFGVGYVGLLSQTNTLINPSKYTSLKTTLQNATPD